MSRRIRAIAQMVPDHAILADIGTDHGYLPILLAEAGTVQHAYACDVAEGPLQQAEANICAKGLTESIQTIRSNGLDQVPMDATCAVLAGMGYHTAVGILERAMERLDRLDLILVQINADVPMLRKWISDHHFTILKERTVEDRGKYYTAIGFNTAAHAPYTEAECYAGVPSAIEDREAYLASVKERIRKIEQILKQGGDPARWLKELNALKSVK